MVRELTEAVRITEQNWGDDSRPVVSVFNWSFNHVKFIRQSIESILEQKTTFPVEIIIHDDASADGTQEIIREYETRYPRLFRNIIQKENQWSQGNSVMDPMIRAPRGKYIALTHGDDCWADPFKLQKQVEYLEDNPDCVLSCHDACTIDQHDQVTADSRLRPEEKRDLTREELAQGGYVLTLTMCFRNCIREFPPEMKSSPNGDLFLCVMLSEFGSCHFHSDIQPAKYRMHEDGVWSLRPQHMRWENAIATYAQLIPYLKRCNRARLKDFYVRFSLEKQESLFIHYLLHGKSKEWLRLLLSQIAFAFTYTSFLAGIRKTARLVRITVNQRKQRRVR